MKNRRDNSRTYQATVYFNFDGRKTRKTFKFQTLSETMVLVDCAKEDSDVWKIVVKECWHWDCQYNFTCDKNVLRYVK